MYVPGTVADTENVLVDIGTGYYVEVGECSGNPSCYVSTHGCLHLLASWMQAFIHVFLTCCGCLGGVADLVCHMHECRSELSIAILMC